MPQRQMRFTIGSVMLAIAAIGVALAFPPLILVRLIILGYLVWTAVIVCWSTGLIWKVVTSAPRPMRTRLAKRDGRIFAEVAPSDEP